jgi:hypothetical protein
MHAALGCAGEKGTAAAARRAPRCAAAACGRAAAWAAVRAGAEPAPFAAAAGGPPPAAADGAARFERPPLPRRLAAEPAVRAAAGRSRGRPPRGGAAEPARRGAAEPAARLLLRARGRPWRVRAAGGGGGLQRLAGAARRGRRAHGGRRCLGRVPLARGRTQEQGPGGTRGPGTPPRPSAHCLRPGPRRLAGAAARRAPS